MSGSSVDTQRTPMHSVRDDFNFTPPALREVTLRVAAVGGINLGQGVCQTPTPPEVIDFAQKAMAEGHNRYAPAQGITELREAFAEKLESFNNMNVDPDQVLVTGGATGAFESVVQAILQQGDEVILFRPFYPYHRNAVLRARANIKVCDMTPPDWNFSRDEFLKCFTPKTKLVVITTPNNPTGKVFTREELEWIGTTAAERGVWCVVDEVYEYLTYDNREHVSMASIPDLADSTITMGSFSKTYSVTGWRVGYIVAPKSIIQPLRTVSDQLYVCAPTPLQYAIARAMLALKRSYYAELLASYDTKRKLMGDILTKAGFDFAPPQGAYYILASIKRRFPDKTAPEVLDRMIERSGIGAVPTIDFVGPEGVRRREDDHLLRFCFSVPDETLHEVARRFETFE